jgi:cyclopropane fatty-acyl-phospholipid synthase-like methyltransferase
MDQTASNEMSNISSPAGNNVSDSWEDNNIVNSGEIPASWDDSPQDPPPTYQESSTSTFNIDLDKLITMVKENDFKELSVNDLNELNSNLFVYKLIFQDENFIEKFFEYVYKSRNKFNFFKNLLSTFKINIELIESQINDSQSLESLYRLIKQIIKIDKGQYILKLFPYKEIITKLFSVDEYSIPLYFISGISSTLPVFIEVDSLFHNKSCIDGSSKSILSAACRNSDVRVLKYIVNNFHNYHKPSWNNSGFIKMLISQIFSYHIPIKHSLRRMKIISSKINLIPYFSFMVDTVSTLDTLMVLKKYYHTEDYKVENNNINSITNMIFSSEYDDISISKPLVESCLSLFNNKYEKADLLLNIFTRSRSFFDIDITKYIDSNYESLKNSISIIVDNIFNDYTEELNDSIYKSYNSNDLKILFSLCKPNISIYMKQKYVQKLLFIMPFIDYFPTEPPKNFNLYNFTNLACKLNLIKYTIRIWLRRNHKVLKLESKIKKIKLLDEIQNFKPNSNVSILSKGSYNYQLIQQKFTKIPARHILPLELNNLTETKDGLYLIKEKADGCLVEFVSKDVEPIIPEYSRTTIKAEFIEELDLYLIFDIKLENSTFIERYSYLRELHPATRGTCESKIDCVETFEDLKEEIRKERERFTEFLKLPYKNYRVYPKASWLVRSLKSQINKELIFNIIEENDHEYICEEGEYLNDGIIITPLNGNRELKIKPKSMHTLDLLYDGRNWVDRENNSWNHIIETNTMHTKNTIWRCFPTFKQKNGEFTFEPKEYRFDKSKPNRNNIVVLIYKLHLINWKKTCHVGEKFFYHLDSKFKSSKFWSNLKTIQNENLASVLDKIDPIFKSKWLDLGCGSSKLLKFIKKYNPSKYVGLDFDTRQLLKGMNRIDSNQHFLNYAKVIPSDLTNLWSSHPLAWDNFDREEKFDYIVCNFSLSHFHSDLFWEQLNDVSKENTIFMFNLVNRNATEAWKSNDDYLYLDKSEVKYRFNSIHNHEMKENYVSDDEILKYSKKFKWSIQEKITPIGDDLDSKYTWYLLRHM